MREQFFEGEPPLRGVTAFVEQLERRIGRRAVHHAQRVAQRRQAERREHLGRQPIADPGGLELAQRLTDERAQPRLRHALGDGIDGRQRVLRRRFVGEHPAVLGVHHLEAERPAAHLAEAADARAAREALLLGGAEMEEPQRQEPRAVGDAAQQLTPPAEHHFGELHLALDDGARAGDETADRQHAGAVLVAGRQHEQQVLHLLDTEHREPRGERLAHAAQRGDRPLFARVGHGPADQSRCRMQSISTRAPFGSCDTPTVTRDGQGCGRYCAMISFTLAKLPRSVR